MVEASPLVEHSPYVGIFLLLILGEIGLPFPEDATLILSGFLIAQKVTKPVPTVIVVYCGLLLTDFSLYWVGKKYGRKVVEHKKFRRILPAERLLALEEKFKKWGIYVVLVGRHFLGIRAQVFLAAGVMRMSALKFVMADAASAILTITLMVGIGFLGGNSIQILQKDVKRVEHVGILILAILLTGWVLYKYFRNRKKRWETPRQNSHGADPK
ncbi:MAG TPA: DedA family protein [Thermodesulfobacteriota bacterium]|nr:DedA family protein [Thermodesulfobacteriota bacterium]